MSKWDIFPMNSEEEWKWLSSQAECAYCSDTNGMVIYRDENLVGAVALDSWSYNSVTIHVAISDPLAMKNGFPEEVFSYIFNACGRGVVIGITPSNNQKALSFNRKVGLIEIYRIKDAYSEGVDYVVQELRKENCKYLRKDNGQEINSEAA